MKLKAEPLIIPIDDPFKNDALDRKDSAEILTQFISNNSDQPLVLAIDSPWGTGKSTFIDMWGKQLSNSGFQTIYFNAWENDFSDDALAALIGEFDIAVDQLCASDGDNHTAKNSIKNIKAVGSKFLKVAGPIAVRLATAGLVDSKQISDAVENGLSEMAQKAAEQYFESYKSAKLVISDFKEELATLIQSIRKDNQPLVFIIDELDRCRPTFAIEVLEKAKHLFMTTGIVFVIAMDKEQLSHSIKSVYGESMDAEGYLRRFFDFDYRFPEPSAKKLANYLAQRFGLENTFQEGFSTASSGEDAMNTFLEIFGTLSKVFGLSLRSQEQCMSQLSIALSCSDSINDLHPHLLAILILVKSVNPKLYRRYILKQASPAEMVDFITTQGREGVPFKNEILDFLSTNNGAIAEAYLFVATGFQSDISTQLNKYKNSSDSTLNRRHDRLESAYDDLQYDRNTILLEQLDKKIGIAERFKPVSERPI